MSGALAIFEGAMKRVRAGQQAEQNAFGNYMKSRKDDREQESHDLDMPIKQEKVDEIQKKKDDERMQAVQLKIEDAASGQDMPYILTAEDMEMIKKTPAGKYLDDKTRQEYLDSVKLVHDDIPAAIQGDKEAYGRLMKNVDPLLRDRLSLGGKREYKDINFVPAGGGKLAIQATFQKKLPGPVDAYATNEEGKPVFDDRPAPLTKNASSDPNDPVNLYSIGEIMPKILQTTKMLKGLGRLVELGRAGEGSTTALKAIEGRKLSKATSEAVKAGGAVLGDEALTSENVAKVAAAVYENAPDTTHAKEAMTLLEKTKPEKSAAKPRNLMKVTSGTSEVLVDPDAEGGPKEVYRGAPQPKKVYRGAPQPKKETKAAGQRRDKLIKEIKGDLLKDTAWSTKSSAERSTEAEIRADRRIRGEKAPAPTATKENVDKLKTWMEGLPKEDTFSGTDMKATIRGAVETGHSVSDLRAAVSNISSLSGGKTKKAQITKVLDDYETDQRKGTPSSTAKKGRSEMKSQESAGRELPKGKVLDSMPPASQYPGKRGFDEATQKWYKSDGKKWNPES
jgi:hypothetical protein